MAGEINLLYEGAGSIWSFDQVQPMGTPGISFEFVQRVNNFPYDLPASVGKCLHIAAKAIQNGDYPAALEQIHIAIVNSTQCLNREGDFYCKLIPATFDINGIDLSLISTIILPSTYRFGLLPNPNF